MQQWVLIGARAAGKPLLEWDEEGCTWAEYDGCEFRHDQAYRLAPEPVTRDSVDWSHVAEGWSYMARNEDGVAFLYVEKPEVREHQWAMLVSGKCRTDDVLASYKRGTVPWDQSLIVRPGYEEGE
jgi:hypothetical protein